MTDNAFAPPRSNVEVKEGPGALWDMTFKEVLKDYLASLNVRALGVLYGLGALGCIGGAFAGLAGTRSGPQPTGMVYGLMGLFIGIGVLYLLACVTSYTRPVWGRWLGIVLAALSLLSFPIGTAIGILALIAYIQGKRLFGPERFLHKDVTSVYRQRKKDKQ
jgi:hypothetical protein